MSRDLVGGRVVADHAHATAVVQRRVGPPAGASRHQRAPIDRQQVASGRCSRRSAAGTSDTPRSHVTATSGSCAESVTSSWVMGPSTATRPWPSPRQRLRPSPPRPPDTAIAAWSGARCECGFAHLRPEGYGGQGADERRRANRDRANRAEHNREVGGGGVGDEQIRHHHDRPADHDGPPEEHGSGRSGNWYASRDDTEHRKVRAENDGIGKQHRLAHRSCAPASASRWPPPIPKAGRARRASGGCCPASAATATGNRPRWPAAPPASAIP